MTQTTALIVHELFDSPNRWLENQDGTVISNGYYRLHLDGSKFGMGTATYNSEHADKESLLNAIASWKEETGWVPKSKSEDLPRSAPRLNQLPDMTTKAAHDEFVRSIRNHHKSFSVHKDATVFSLGVQSAISKFDETVRPVEMMEGKK